MCGIAGFFNIDGAPVSARVLKQMMEIQRHRGPDDQGARLFSLEQATSLEINPDIESATAFEGALGFNRLSILDLSHNGHQPMINTAGNIIIAYNGEVYNAVDFRDELAKVGYHFRSSTDTEVILYLYEQFGLEGMLSRIRGMFAFCIVDLRKGEILMARDHLGIKPLYYSVQNATFMFASEVKSFLPHHRFMAQISEEDLNEYLCFRFCSGERTLLRNVYQLRPGHYMRLCRGDAVPRVTRYWSIPETSDDGPKSLGAAVDEIEALLKNSVARHLITDVKLGCQLSGGIDSSLVTYFARSHFDANLEAFSVDFDDPDFSEAKWISQAAAKADVNSHMFMLDGTTMAQDIERVTWHADRPANLTPMFGLYHLGRNASRFVTVLLSGEGSDELMGGYPRFYWAAVRKRYATALRLAAKIPIFSNRAFGPQTMKLSSQDAYIMSNAAMWPEAFAELRPMALFDQAFDRRRAMFAEGQSGFLANCQKYALQTYLVFLLVHQDKLMMAHSVENRVPFVDVALVEAVRRFPSRYLVGAGIIPRRGSPYNTKICLKKLASQIFGKDFAYRKKMGFLMPICQAFKTPVFKEILQDRILPGIRQRGWYDPAGLERCLNLIPACESDPRSFWRVAAVEIWAQQFLDGSLPK